MKPAEPLLPPETPVDGLLASLDLLTITRAGAVLHLRLVPGSYTIVVGSADGQTGVALMETYASQTFTLPPAN